MLTCSALHGEGIDAVWQAVRRQRQALEDGGELAAKRARQTGSWLWAEVQAGLADALRADPAPPSSSRRSRTRSSGRLLPPQAARALIRRFRGGGA